MPTRYEWEERKIANGDVFYTDESKLRSCIGFGIHGMNQ